MRSFRLLSLGTCSPSWTPQVASLRCKYIASPCQGICRSRRSVEFRDRREGFGTLLRELRSHSANGVRRGSPQLVRSSLRDSSELLSSGYGHHYGVSVLPSLLDVRARPYVSVAGKKGKKADRDVLVKEREEDLEEEQHEIENESEEKAKGKKKLKGLNKHDAVENFDGNAGNVEAEAQLKQKKKKLKELFGKRDEVVDRSDEVEENEQLEGSESAVNGAVLEQNSDTKKEEKLKKKLKSKAKDEYSDNGKKEENVQAHLKQKEKKKQKRKAKTEDESDEGSIKDGSVSDLEGSEEGEEMESFENTEASASVMEVEIAEEIDDHLDDDDFWEDDLEPEAEVDDGGDGGGIILGDALWARSALQSAEGVVADFNGSLALFAFKASKENSLIRLRLDKLSDKYGSPTMEEIEKFSSSYSKVLNQAGEAGTIPNDLSLEVSSPGAERVVRIPQDLKRFKELPMYVRYLEKASNDTEEVPAKDGILELESIDTEGGTVTWKLANVRLNRELTGKGRGLNRKQRDWRAQLPFESLQLVRLYIDV